jgi:predicted RNase H-like nuclease (RuvC/YqgF family)
VESTSGDVPGFGGETRAVDGALKALWDRARRAGELITSLRQENSSLRNRVQELQSRVLQLEEEVERQRQLPDPGAEAERGAVVFRNGERELLISRLRHLLAKLEAYL